MSINLNYQEEHDLTRDAARRWLGENSAISEVRRLAADAQGDSAELWSGLADMGWLGLLLPEQFDGLELGATHLAVLLEESGRQLLPAPLLPTTLAGLLISQAGTTAQKEAWLPKIASGECRASIAHVDANGSWAFAPTAVQASGGKLTGEKHQVWGATTADIFIIPFQDDAETQLAIVEAGSDGLRIEPEIGLDPSRRQGRIILEQTPIAADAVLASNADAAFAELLPWACLALAAEMAGGADALLNVTAEYAITREQFDKQIGSFQAIKHPLVNVLIEVEKTRSLVYAAASALDEGHQDAEKLARMAKAQASDTYPFAASRAVQFHGGFGFTEECDAHLYLRRAQCTRAAFGDASHHRTWLGERLRDEH